MATLRNQPQPVPTPTPVPDDEAQAVIDSVFGTGQPAAAPATPAAPTAAPPTTQAAPQASGPAGLEEIVKSKGGKRPVNEGSPGEVRAPEVNPITGDVLASGVTRYLWDDGDWVDVRDGKVMNGDLSVAQGKASPWQVRNDPDGNLIRVNPQTGQTEVLVEKKGKGGTTIKTASKGSMYLDPSDGQWKYVAGQTQVSAPSNQKNLVYQDAQGNVSAKPNPNYDQAAAARTAELEQIKLAKARGEISLEQAKAQVDAINDKFSQWYKERQLELQGKTLESSQRGQDMTYAVGMANNATSAAASALPYLVPKGWHENFNKSIASLGSGSSAPVEYGAPMTAPFPYDPIGLGRQVVSDILGTQGGKPPAPVQLPSFTAPPALTGQMSAANAGVQSAYAASQPPAPAPAAAPPAPAPVAAAPVASMGGLVRGQDGQWVYKPQGVGGGVPL
jgi:hypothetical protein